MKKYFSLKNIVLVLAGGLIALALVVTAIIVTFDDDDYRRLLIGFVDLTSDYRLEIAGPFHFSFSAAPELSASDIKLHSNTGDNNISLQKFGMQFTLAPLLDGTLQVDRLLVADVVAQLTDPSSVDGEDSEPGFTPGYFWPALVLKSAAISNIVVIVDAENDNYTLNHLSVDDIENQGPLLIDASGSISGKSFTIKGQLGSLRELFAEQAYPVDVVLSTPLLTASLQGQIVDALHANGLDLKLNFEATNLKELIHPDFPDSTRIGGNAKLRGDLYQPEISDLDVVLTRDDRIKVTASGAIANIMTGTGIDILLSGVIADSDIGALLFSDSMPQFNNISFDARLIDSKDTIRLADINARLSDPLGLKTTLVGNMDFNLDTTNFIRAMAISATLDSATTVAARPFLVDVIPEMGPVTGKVTINSHAMDLVIRDIDIIVGAGQPVNLQIKGYIGKAPLDPDVPNSDITLDLALSADRARSVGVLFQHDLPDIGPVVITTRFTRGTEDGRFDNLQLTAGELKSLAVTAEGYIQILDNNKAPVSLDSSLIKISAKSTSLAKASRRLGFALPDLGPVKADMTLYSDGGDFSGRDVNMQIGRQQTLLINLVGSIAKLPLTTDPISGIDLKGSIRTRSTSALSVLASGKKIPDIGPLSGQFNIKGNSSAISIGAITFDAGRKDKLTASARGNIEQLVIGNDQFKGVNIFLSANAPTTSALSDLVGQEIIDMGPLTLTGQIGSDQNLLQLNNLEIVVGSREDPALLASGSVNNLLEGSGIAVNIPFNEQILYQFLTVTPKPPVALNGNIFLSDADGSFGIDALTLETEQSNILAVKIHGGIDDIMHGDKINVDASISIEDLERLGNMFSLDLPTLGSIELQGKLIGSNEQASFDGLFKFNQTEVTSKLTVSHMDEHPAVKGSIYIPVLHLQDFGIKPELQKPNQQAQSNEQSDDHFFSRTPIAFDPLHKLDLDIKVDIDELEGTEFVVDTVDMDIKLNKGVLKIDSAKFKYADGQVNGNLSVDANKPLRLKLSLIGDDVNLKGLMLQARIPSPIEGTMHLVIDLSSTGTTAHELASNLDGEIGITLENGMIRRRQIDMLFLDFVDWLFTFGISNNETKITCAIANYKINQGILDTEIFYLDGPKITARGEGTVDFRTEIIDTIINLEKKKLLFNSRTPIHIRGNLSDPTVLPIPYKQAVISVGGYIFAPFVTIPAEALGAVGMLLFEPGSKSSCQERVAKL